MEDILLVEALERYMSGEMTDAERLYFEELRKNNPELDQMVVEHTIFFNELNRFTDLKNFKQKLQETSSEIANESLTIPAKEGSVKVISFYRKWKKTIAVAASIAGIVSIFIASLVSRMTSEKAPNNTTLLVKNLDEKLDAQANKTRQIENKLNTLAAATAVVTEENNLPIDAKFRATGFLIDVTDNFVVTNAHVVREAKHRLIVENSKGEQFLAEPVYVNTQNDLAIIRIVDKDFKNLPALPYTIRKTNAELGEQIFMLGFPKQEIVYGEGYVSAKNGYQMDTIYCQLSTSANEGNSGSPVINKYGELLGVVTSMETNAPGVVFAIKSPNIYQAIEEVKKMKEHNNIKITSSPSLKGADRVSQIKKVQDYVFMIKGN